MSFNNNIAVVEVNKKDYETWTVSEEQNRKVALGNNLIQSVESLKNVLGVKVYPATVSQSVSGFVGFNIATNKYFLNPTYFKD